MWPSLCHLQNCIIVFGGIHDIAHEKNDLNCFNLEKNEWTKLDSDFTEKINPVTVFPIKMTFLKPKAKNKVGFKTQTKSKVHREIRKRLS